MTAGAAPRSPGPSPEDDASEVSRSEALFHASDYAGAFDVLHARNIPAMPIPLLDRALPILLMSGDATLGEEFSVTVLDDVERQTADAAAPIASIVRTYRSEATAEPRRRAVLATAALEGLPAEAPIARHRALAVLLAAKVDIGEGLDGHLLAQMEEVEREIDLVASVDSALAQRGFLAYQVGQLDESRTALRLLKRKARADQQPFIESVFATHLATVDAYAGRLAAAAALLDSYRGETPVSPAAARALGLIALRAADDVAFQEVLLQPTLQGSAIHGAFTRRALTGLGAARREEWREAYSQLSRAQMHARSLGLEEPGRRMWIDVDLARAAIAIGRPGEAARISDNLERLSAGARPILDGMAGRIRGVIAGSDDPAASIAILEESVAALAGAGFPDQLALSLLELGRALTRAERYTDARKALDRARVLTGLTGDRAIGLLVDRALRLTSSDALLAALTSRERQIAFAAARGATSREIAEAGFTSIRTVETQLSSAYRKLGITSRAQLTVLLADHLRERAHDPES